LTSGPGNPHLNNWLVNWSAANFPGIGAVLPQGSLLTAALVLSAVMLARARDRDLAEEATAVASAAALAWAACCSLWAGGYLWKILNWPVRDVRGIGLGQSVRLQCLPGVGLWIALGGAGAALVLFAFILVQRRRPLWFIAALLLGVALGAAIVALIVRPWDVNESQFLPG